MTSATTTFSFTDEQQEWRRVVHEALERSSPPSEVMRAMETEAGFDPDAWSALAGQMELRSIAIPEDLGGAGYSFREVAIALEEMGRFLLCAPYFSSVVLAANALLCADDRAAQEEHLPSIASGESIATVAFEEAGAPWNAPPTATLAAADGDRHLLTGRKTYVIDGLSADLLLVSASVGDEVGLFAVHGDAPGVARAAQSTMDQTRKLATVELESAEATRIAGDAGAALSRTFEAAVAGLAAEQVGGMRACLDLALAYAKDRLQFGQPIGTFQAVKHRLAEMYVLSEQAASAATDAAAAVAEGADDAGLRAAVAKAFCSEAYTRIAADTIQLHGGIGTTWEHPAHLYLKRAKSSEVLFGTSRHHRREIAAELGIDRGGAAA